MQVCIRKTGILSGILLIAFSLSIGAVISIFMEIGDSKGYELFTAIVPRLLIYTGILLLVKRVLYRKYFTKGDLVKFFGIVFFLCIIGTVSAVFIEHQIKIGMGIDLGAFDFLSLHIWAYIFSNSIFIFIIAIGLLSLMLYNSWGQQIVKEKELINEYEEKIAPIKARLEALNLTQCIDEIIDSILRGDSDVQLQIGRFSEELCQNIYDLNIPSLLRLRNDLGIGESKMFSLLTCPKYSILRYTVLELFIIIISLGAFFPCFQLNFSLFNLSGVLVSIVTLNIIVFLNRFVLFPAFSNLKVYLCVISIPVILWGVVSLFANMMSYSGLSTSEPFTKFMALLSSFGSMIVIGVFWLGIGAFLCFQDWLRAERRISLLSIRNIEAEYNLLKQQLNPHFLFNVLNNIDFVIEENTDLAIQMLNDLKMLLNYHLQSSNRNTVALKDEIRFLTAYLSLEAIRHVNFNFNIKVDGEQDDVFVPPLLFMPFVENAVKHGEESNGNRLVDASFNVSISEIEFKCINTVSNPTMDKKECKSGIGIRNTKGRLELLFADNYSLSLYHVSNKFVTTLKIPKIK